MNIILPAAMIGATAASAAAIAYKNRQNSQNRQAIRPGTIRSRDNGTTAEFVVGGRSVLVRGLQNPRMIDVKDENGVVISQRNSPHNGVDLSGAVGQPVHAVKSGVILSATPENGYGNCIQLQHDAGNTSSIYAHLDAMFVQPGQRVLGGELIGHVGNTAIGPNGRVEAWMLSMGPHLHFEIHPTSQPNLNPLARRSDPVVWLRQQGIRYGEV